jgi:hypothetical protein
MSEQAETHAQTALIFPWTHIDITINTSPGRGVDIGLPFTSGAGQSWRLGPRLPELSIREHACRCGDHPGSLRVLALTLTPQNLGTFGVQAQKVGPNGQILETAQITVHALLQNA